MNTYKEILKCEMLEKGIVIADMVKHTSIKEGRLQAIIDGKQKAKVEELIEICTYLSMDVNQVLHINVRDNEGMILSDPLEIRLNVITRGIQKKNQKDFVKAVEYLAECFIMKDKREK